MKSYLLGCFILCLFVNTMAQYRLIKDLNPGFQNGIPDWREDAVTLGDKIIFSGDDGILGTELYVLQDLNISLVKDILEGANGSDPYALTIYKDEVYFSAQNAEGKYDIYKTDGTAENTELAITLTSSYHVEEFFVAANGKLYIQVGWAMYVSEGSDATTERIASTYTIDFDNSWTYNSTSISDYKDGVVFHCKDGTDQKIIYHHDSEIEVLHSFSAESFSHVLGPVVTQDGVLYAVRDNFNSELEGLFFISDETGEAEEIKYDNESIDVIRIYNVNGKYCFFFAEDKIFSTTGNTLIELTDASAYGYSLYQGEFLYHAVSGDKLFFWGSASTFDDYYYVTDGSVEGTIEVPTPGESYPGRILLEENGYVYMTQGTVNGKDLSIVKIDIDNATSEILLEWESNTSGSEELLGLISGNVYFSSERNEKLGREIYVADRNGDLANELVLPYNGSKTVTTCDTTVYDFGGSIGFYSSFENGQMVLLPDTEGKAISLEFEELDFTGDWDSFIINNSINQTIFDNTTTSSDPITSIQENGGITIRFSAGSESTSTGFKINVSCVDLDPSTIVKDVLRIPKDGRTKEIITCDTVAYDNGGPLNVFDYADTSAIKFIPAEADKVISLDIEEISLGYTDKLHITSENQEIIYDYYTTTGGVVNSTSSNGEILVTMIADWGGFDGVKIRVTCVDPSETAIKDNFDVSLHVFPNPTSDIINYTWSENSKHHLLLFDASGSLIDDQVRYFGENNYDVSSLSNGTYTVKLESSTHSKSFEFIKLN